MVATKTKKIVKYTYAERVLGAFSMAQREQRRTSVHLATVRAQVRKSAEAKNDKLGPQWSKFVTKSLHKLSDELGIFAPTEAAGTLMLTPKAKKSIASARKSLGIAAHQSPSETQEDSIWKHVIHDAAIRGLKRAREDTSGDEYAGVPESTQSSPLTRSKRSKRARPSPLRPAPALPKKTLSTMTKFELRAELEALQIQQSRADSSPEIDQTPRLQEKLARQEQEIADIRKELSETRNQHLAAIDETPMEQDISSRAPSPERMINFGIHPSATTPHVNASHGVVRTQSGSLISQLSKQPTPAPSDTGIDNIEYDDVFGGLDNRSSGNAISSGDSLVTPQSAPRHGVTLADGRHPSQNSEMLKLLAKVSSLEKELDIRQGDLRKIDHSFSQLRSEHMKVQVTLSERDAVVVSLQADVAKAKFQASQQQLLLSERDDLIQDLERSKTALEAACALQVSHLARLELDLKDHHADVASLKADLQATLSRVSHLETTLLERDNTISDVVTSANISQKALSSQIDQQLKSADAQHHLIAELKRSNGEHSHNFSLASSRVDSLQEQLRTSEASNRTLLQEQSQADAVLAASQSSLLEMNNLISSLRVDADSSKVSIADLDQELLKKESTNQTLSNDLVLKDQKLSEMGVSLVDARATVHIAMNQNKKLEEQLDANLQEYRKGCLSLEEAVSSLRGEIGTAHVHISNMESDLSAASAEQAVASSTISALQSSIADAQCKARSTEARLAESIAAYSALQDLYQSSLKSLQLLQSRFATESTRIVGLETKLSETETELAGVKIAKATDEATIETLKEGFTHLRAVQLQSLDDLGNTVSSSQSSPMPLTTRSF